MTNQNFNVAKQGSGDAQKAAAILGKSISRLGAAEAITSDNAPKGENPFKVMAARQAQAAVNQAAAELVEEKAAEAAEKPAQVTQVSPAAQPAEAPIAPTPEGNSEAGFEFFYGTDYWSKIEAFIGCKVAELRNFENNAYVTPYWKAYQLPDGRVMKITDKVVSGLVRLFPDWHSWNAHQNAVWNSYPDPETGRYPKPQKETSQAISAPITPTVIAPTSQPTGQRELVINTLLESPLKIALAKETFDEAERAYQRRLARRSIEALSDQLFVGKDNTKRAAGNDVERELAIKEAANSDPALIALAQERETALRQLRLAENTFEAVKLAAQLLSKS